MEKIKVLENYNEDLLTELFMLKNKINKVKQLLEEFDYKRNTTEDLLDFINYIIYYLGDKEIEEIPLFEGTLEQLNNLSIIGDKENE